MAYQGDLVFFEVPGTTLSFELNLLFNLYEEQIGRKWKIDTYVFATCAQFIPLKLQRLVKDHVAMYYVDLLANTHSREEIEERGVQIHVSLLLGQPN